MEEFQRTIRNMVRVGGESVTAAAATAVVLVFTIKTVLVSAHICTVQLTRTSCVVTDQLPQKTGARLSRNQRNEKKMLW